MKKGITKQINIMLRFNDNGDVIDGTEEGTKDSRFLGVTFFDEYGNKSFLDDKQATISIPYFKMTDIQKKTFDKLIFDYVSLKDD